MGEAKRRLEEIDAERDRMGSLPQAPNTVRLRAWAWRGSHTGYHQVDVMRSYLRELRELVARLEEQQHTYVSACRTVGEILLSRTHNTVELSVTILDPLLGMLAERGLHDYKLAWEDVSRIEMMLRYDDAGRCRTVFEFNQRKESLLVPAYFQNLSPDPAILSVAIIDSASHLMVTEVERRMIADATPLLRVRYQRAVSLGFAGDIDEFSFAILHEGFRLHQIEQFAAMHQDLFRLALCYAVERSNYGPHCNAFGVVMVIDLTPDAARFRSAYFEHCVEFMSNVLRMVHLAVLSWGGRKPPPVTAPSIRALQLPNTPNIWAAN